MSIQLFSRGGKPTSIISDVDGDLSQYHWGLFGAKHQKYAYRVTGKSAIYLHRLIAERMIGRPLLKNEEVDHINYNTLDNTRDNLRVATRSQNMQNTKLRVSNSTGYKGVYKDKLGGYVAEITHNYHKYHLGRFKTPELAYSAYCIKAKELFGEFFNPG